MNRNVKQVVFDAPPKPSVTRVAAYSRVSSDKDAMLHSLSAQVSYYSSYIQAHEDWLYCGVYADEGLTGTKEDRENFCRLVADCRAGKIDFIITKSISRFARNTVTLLETVRELKDRGIGVYFEEQNINTLTAEGELMLTILASYAQEESLSVSENQKWRIKQNFEEGIPWLGHMLGYRLVDGVYRVIPEEADIVRRIFREFLFGKGVVAIANELNKEGIPSFRGGKWCKSSVHKVLTNYCYTGNLILQKTYINNHLEKKSMKNKGEKPMYHVEESHEPIISMEVFNATQAELLRRAEKHYHPQKQSTYLFTRRLVCDKCGKNYTRKTTATQVVWICPTYSQQGKEACSSKQIPEETLIALTKEVLGVQELSFELLDSRLSQMVAADNNTVIFCLTNGTEIKKKWKDRSRSESWTAEKRELARQRKTKGGKQCQE